ncbi:MAG: hypothetical protein ABI824_16595 [Acidobacteriota bacterium]
MTPFTRRALIFSLFGIAASVSAQYATRDSWIESGAKMLLPEFDTFGNSEGSIGVLNASGDLQTEGHPFFTPLGSNGRACVNCHQPTYGMSLSATSMQDRWKSTDGKDPVFAAFDGSNCPDLPQDQESSHSLLIHRGLFRIPLAWPPKNSDGSAKPVEFTIEVMRDPTGCNTSKQHGLKSANPTISVYRRPRPAANLKYVVAGGRSIIAKTGLLADLDPDSGAPVAMNLMSDAREPSLKAQALSAILGHEQAHEAPSAEQLAKIVEFESQVYSAQAIHIWAGPLMGDSLGKNAPKGLGPVALRDRQLGATSADPVFGFFTGWKEGTHYQASIARGADIFMHRQFWVRDAAHFNSTNRGNPVKGTCASCHGSSMTGQDAAAGWMDVGVSNYPTWTESPTWSETSEVPVFKITCARTADPHPFLGRTIYTTDPGRALITGRCADVGAIVMQQLRGLAARPPYFSNGSANSLREVVDFYDRRFDMKLSGDEKEDLATFLGAL